MLFGATTKEGTTFDPLEHIDLAKCTITVETTINRGITWDMIRSNTNKVPLSHPIWAF